MEPHIKKSDITAEIERLQGFFVNKLDDFEKGYHHGLDMVLAFLDTLKVEEVDLEKELDKYTVDNFWALEGNNESPYLLEKDDILKIAKHFYELGLKAKDVNEIIKTAEDHAYFAGSENTREKLIEKACEWLSKVPIEDMEYKYEDFDTSEGWYKFIEDFRKAMEE